MLALLSAPRAPRVVAVGILFITLRDLTVPTVSAVLVAVLMTTMFVLSLHEAVHAQSLLHIFPLLFSVHKAREQFWFIGCVRTKVLLQLNQVDRF